STVCHVSPSPSPPPRPTPFPYTPLFRSPPPGPAPPAPAGSARRPGAAAPRPPGHTPTQPPGHRARFTTTGHEIACPAAPFRALRSEEHTSELQSRFDLVCRLLLEKKKRQ